MRKELKALIAELTADFNPISGVIRIYRNGVLIHTAIIDSPDDEWFGLNIDENEVDFNIWDNGELNKKTNKYEVKYELTIYPIVTQNANGFWSTDTEIFQSIPMKILEVSN